MKPATAASRILHGIEQYPMLEEVAILNHQLDSRRIHMDDSPGADVQMSNFTVAHLIVRQADVLPAGMNQRVGVLAQQAVVCGLAGEGDGISFGFGAVSPAIEDDEDEGFGVGQASSS